MGPVNMKPFVVASSPAASQPQLQSMCVGCLNCCGTSSASGVLADGLMFASLWFSIWFISLARSSVCDEQRDQ